MLGINLFAGTGVSQQRCHVCCTQPGRPGRWEIDKGWGAAFLQEHIPSCPGCTLSSSDPATPSAWTRTRGSQHRDGLRRDHSTVTAGIWFSAAEEEYSGTLPGKLHLTRHTHLHVCKIRAACVYPCANVRESAKNTKSILLCVLCWTWPRLDSACCFSPQPLPSKLKSLPLLRHGLILNRYTENSSLQWFRNQTGRSVFTGALAEQLGKGQCHISICFLSPAAVFFLCQECKASHWLCSCCQCVCTEGQGREKAERGGGEDLTATKMAHFGTWAFLLCQDSPCTGLWLFEVNDVWVFTRRNCRRWRRCQGNGERHFTLTTDPSCWGSAEILVHMQPPVLLYQSKQGAELLLRWLGSCLEPGSCWAALQHPSVPGTLLPALPSGLYLKEGSSQSACHSSASLSGVLIYSGGVSLPPVLHPSPLRTSGISGRPGDQDRDLIPKLWGDEESPPQSEQHCSQRLCLSGYRSSDRMVLSTL